MSLYNKHTACIYYILYTSTCILWYIFYSGNSPGFGDKGQSVDVQKLYKLQEELTELHKKKGEVK
jgi:hypothetical protein